MFKNRRAYLLCRAGADVGYGHFMRLLAIYETLQSKGWICSFICNYATSKQPILNKYGVSFINRKRFAQQNRDQQINCRKLNKFDWLIVDDYEETASSLMDIRDRFFKVALFRDLMHQSLDADLIIGQGVRQGNCLQGNRYIPIRPYILSIRENLGTRQEEEIKRISVFFGGVDSKSLTLKFTRHLMGMNEHWGIDVFIGSASKDVPKLKEIAKFSKNITLHIDCKCPLKVMAKSSFALGAGGLNAWERAVVGLPSIIAVTSANQTTHVKKLTRAGAANVINIEENNPLNIDKAIALLKNIETRNRMAKAARDCCDGQGAARISSKLLSMSMGKL